MRSVRFAAALLGASIFVLTPAAAFADTPAAHADVPTDESFSEYVPGAAALEGRIISPCCWDENGRQTIDVHGSPIAHELRREIRSRLKAGETSDAIEADLVHRYGPKILATPQGNPLPRMGPALILGLFVGLLVAGRTVSRWKSRGSAPAPSGGPSTGPEAKGGDEWDRRLDAELSDPEK